jgi:hypothetical protein
MEYTRGDSKAKAQNKERSIVTTCENTYKGFAFSTH